MADGSCLAFFEAPDEPFDFKQQHDFDLHIALQVDRETLLAMFEKGREAGIETRGIADHEFIDSIYFRDPNGYVLELSTPKEGEAMRDMAAANGILQSWQHSKVGQPPKSGGSSKSLHTSSPGIDLENRNPCP